MPRVLAGQVESLRRHLVLDDVVSGGRVSAQDMILARRLGVGKTVTISNVFWSTSVHLEGVAGHASR